jgi:hypothetical protein
VIFGDGQEGQQAAEIGATIDGMRNAMDELMPSMIPLCDITEAHRPQLIRSADKEHDRCGSQPPSRSGFVDWPVGISH